MQKSICGTFILIHYLPYTPDEPLNLQDSVLTRSDIPTMAAKWMEFETQGCTGAPACNELQVSGVHLVTKIYQNETKMAANQHIRRENRAVWNIYLVNKMVFFVYYANGRPVENYSTSVGDHSAENCRLTNKLALNIYAVVAAVENVECAPVIASAAVRARGDVIR